MAGAGYKLFNTGDVLLASEVNTYLMQQTVMVFADSAARTTALSGVLAEGMLSYLADTNATEVYDGSSWVSVSGTGDITAVTTGANSGLAGGVTTGNADIKINFASKGQLAVGTGSGTTDFLNVGTNGYTIVANSSTSTGLEWAAPASGGGYTELASGTGSGASLNLTSISGSYRNLVMIWRNVRPDSNGEQLNMRFNSDTNNRYNITENNADNGIAIASTNVINTDPGTNSGATNANTFKQITIYDYANTSTYKLCEVLNLNTDESVNTLIDWRRRAGFYNQTGAITELNFLWTGAANFSGGTYVLYGVK